MGQSKVVTRIRKLWYGMIGRLRGKGKDRQMMGMPSCICKPEFDFSNNVSSVVLRRGQVMLQIDGSAYSGEGEARLDLLPEPRVNLYGLFSDLPPNIAFAAIATPISQVQFFFDACRIEGFPIKLGMQSQSGLITVKWNPRLEPVVWSQDGSIQQMKRVVFHIFNFVQLEGTQKCIEPDGKSAGYIDLEYKECDKWNIRIQSSYTKDSFQKLKEKGGVQLTHVGCISKENEHMFSSAEATEWLDALRLFLSFTKGDWCAPHCAVGYNSTGARVWESWSSPKSGWRIPLSWFDPHHCEQLIDFFPNFVKRWKDPKWQNGISEAIYWYLLANDASHGIDAGIILTQAALERLSFELAVNDRGLLTVDGFRRIRASDKFRLLFSTLNIPTDIPAETSELQKIARQRKWQDAPHALTKIRNTIIHPDNKQRSVQFENLCYEAWNLGLWFLEMSILAICNYSGTYGNRLKQRWTGEVENVPWL